MSPPMRRGTAESMAWPLGKLAVNTRTPCGISGRGRSKPNFRMVLISNSADHRHSHQQYQRGPAAYEEVPRHGNGDEPQKCKAAKRRDVAGHFLQPGRPDRTGGIRAAAKCQQDSLIEGAGVALEDLFRKQPEADQQTARHEQGDLPHRIQPKPASIGKQQLREGGARHSAILWSSPRDFYGIDQAVPGRLDKQTHLPGDGEIVADRAAWPVSAVGRKGDPAMPSARRRRETDGSSEEGHPGQSAA